MKIIKLGLILILLAVYLPAQAWGDVSVRVRRRPASHYRRAPARSHRSSFRMHGYRRSSSRRAVVVKRGRRTVFVGPRRRAADRCLSVRVRRRPRVVIHRPIVIDPWYVRREVFVSRPTYAPLVIESPLVRREVIVERPVVTREVVIERPVERIIVERERIIEKDAYGSEEDYWLSRLNSHDSDDREKAAKKLRKFPSIRARIALENALLSDVDEDVREEAAKSLGKIGDPAAIPVLRHAALRDSEDDVREEAGEAIERIERTLRSP